MATLLLVHWTLKVSQRQPHFLTARTMGDCSGGIFNPQGPTTQGKTRRETITEVCSGMRPYKVLLGQAWNTPDDGDLPSAIEVTD